MNTVYLNQTFLQVVFPDFIKFHALLWKTINPFINCSEKDFDLICVVNTRSNKLNNTQ